MLMSSVVNHFRDVKDPEIHELAPGDVVMYTWEYPLEKRELTWSCGDKKNQHCELVKVC